MKIARIVMGMVLAIAGVAFIFAGGASAHSNHDAKTKVWVCKYVGKPGVDERLKGGKNPISVSSNATVGEWFNDAQGRSFVLAVDDGGDAPDVSQCPAPEGNPGPSPTPTVTVTESVPVPGPTTTVTNTETKTVTASPSTVTVTPPAETVTTTEHATETATSTVTNTETVTNTATATVTETQKVTLPQATVTVTEKVKGKTVTHTVKVCPPGKSTPPTNLSQTGGDLTLGTLLGTALVLGGLALVFGFRKKTAPQHI